MLLHMLLLNMLCENTKLIKKIISIITPEIRNNK